MASQAPFCKLVGNNLRCGFKKDNETKNGGMNYSV